ncbi:MAG TPA: hypothetical protein VHG10_05260 [Glycomyces sp.]|nr:hypothetical protein [Glycomyces sp.]
MTDTTQQAPTAAHWGAPYRASDYRAADHRVSNYQASVERHLADLPDDLRRMLTADLRTRLTEVAAGSRPNEALEHRLGSAERYAMALRETVELQYVSAADRVLKSLGKTLTAFRLSLRRG